MNFNWGSFPFFRFVIAFTTGIICAVNSFFEANLFYLFLLLILIYLAVWLMQRLRFKTHFKPILGFVSLLILFVFGFELTKLRTEKMAENHLINISEGKKIVAVKGLIVDRIKETQNSYKTILKITDAKIDSNWLPAQGRLLCYFKKDSLLTINYGDEILVSAFITTVSEPKNPEEFNYKKYLSFHQIHHQTFIKPHQYQTLTKDNFYLFTDPNLLISQSIKIRNFFEGVLASSFQNKRELGIAQALILGVKDELENDIIVAYSGVGAMHVLAVSGLHVGLVYQVFVLVFGRLKRSNIHVHRLFQAVILLLFIWMYAFITGLSPSVIRAATMFSFIIIANATKRNTNIYNTLAVSGFFLLCINPFLIVEVGFQLSYLAVLGIVYIQPKLYNLVPFNHVWLDKIWAITCVSIAAQIGTFPISILYFHQFPTYFFLSNIIVIPAAIIILYLGLFILTIHWIEIFYNVISYALDKIIWVVNEIIIWISDLPYSLINELNINVLEALIIYTLILLLFMFLAAKKVKIYMLAVLILSYFTYMQFDEIITQQFKKEIIFYSINRSSAMGLRDAEKIVFIGDSSLIYNEDKLQFHIKNHWWKENIKQITTIPTHELPSVNGNKFLVWNGKKIILYRQPITHDFKEKITVDYLIIQENVWVDKSKIEKNIDYHLAIIDGTNNFKTRKFTDKNLKNSIDLVENGAFIDAIYF